MRLYHGTDLKSAKNICENGIDFTKSKNKLDFGRGFYLTDDYERACIWAKRKAYALNTSPAIVNVEFDITSAKGYIRSFKDDTVWAQFIINNRNGYDYLKNIEMQENNLDSKYDITYGRIADLDVTNIAMELLKSKKPIVNIETILNRDYSMQYAFHTDFSKTFLNVNGYTKI